MTFINMYLDLMLEMETFTCSFIVFKYDVGVMNSHG